MTNIDLRDKKILLTGASSGIGKALADYLMQMGAQVAVHYNSNRKIAEALVANYSRTGSQAFKSNLGVEAEVVGLFNNVMEQFGKIDVMILNAGIYQPHSTNESMKDWMSVWKKTMAVNLNAVGILTKLGLEHFLEKQEGRFIYVGSRAVFRGETEEYLAYAASKGGITSLGRSVARSFGKHNVKAFIISPGFVKTPMADSFIATHGEERILNELSLKSLTKPEDLAPLVALMCSGLMDHATGATIDVNAGSHIR